MQLQILDNFNHNINHDLIWNQSGSQHKETLEILNYGHFKQ